MKVFNHQYDHGVKGHGQIYYQQIINNNRTTTLEWASAEATRWGDGVNVLYQHITFTQDYAVVRLYKQI